MKRRIFENGVDCAHFSRCLPSRQTCFDVVQCTTCGEAKPIIDFEYCSEFNARQRNSVSVHSTDCKVCRIARLSGLKASGLWDKNIEAYWVSSFGSIRQGAKSRGIILAIKPQDCYERYLEQCGRCAITDLPMKIDKKTDKRFLPSIDRINSNKHYTINNIQVVLRCVNIMKGALPTGLFYDLCSHIAVRQATGQLCIAA